MMVEKVLFVTTVVGTVRSFLLPLAQHFCSRGWQVDAMARGVTSCPFCRREFNGTWDVNWSRNPWNLGAMLAAAARIRSLTIAQGYDIVHVHTPIAAFVTRCALGTLPRRQRPQVIYTAHGFHFYQGNSFLKNAFFITVEKIAGCWTDYLVVINPEDELAARRLRLVQPARIRYMPGIGVDTSYYSPDAVLPEKVAGIRRELALQPDESLFLMVAAFRPGKRQEDALKALAHLTRPSAHLAFAGEGPTFDAMRRMAVEKGVGNRVHFLGYRSDIPALIGASVATLLPSEREGLPRSLMESLSLAVPAIGTNIRGVRDLLDGDETLLVPVGDVVALAGAMAWVLDHPAEAQEIGRLGRARMMDYDTQVIIAGHDQLYAEALGHRTLR